MKSDRRAFAGTTGTSLPLRLVRLLFPLSLVACGSAKTETHIAPPAPSAPQSRASAPRPNPIRDAAIEGDLVDSKTRERLAGGTIVAKPLSDGLQEVVVISDDAGHFKLAVSAGTHHVIVYYADTTTDRGNIDVKSAEVARLDVEIDHDAVVAAEKAAERPLCPPVVGQPPVSSADIDKLAADVLARGTSAIPDGGLLPERGPIYVASDVDGPVHLTAAALPKGRSTKLALRTMQELQAEADRRGTNFKYLRFTTLEIAGTCATVDVGVYIMTPSRSHDTFLCCCSAIDLYDKRNGRWVFRTNVTTICA